MRTGCLLNQTLAKKGEFCCDQMKRSPEEKSTAASKKQKVATGVESGKGDEIGDPRFHLDEDMLFEVLKHVDARSLAAAACVSKQWYTAAQDERLWEMICTRHWANIGCGNQQLRSVVLALGGFRRLHSHCLRPLLKTSPSSSHSPAPSTSIPSPAMPGKGSAHWGKDEVHLSLSLLSIRYYEKMNFNKRGR